MHWIRTVCASLAIAISLSTPSLAGPVDKSTDFVIDISSVCNEPVGLRLRTKKNWWQLPPARVRKGFGLAFFVVDDVTTNNSMARVYIEVEPLDDRTLDEAFKEAAEGLADTMAPFDTELLGGITRADPRKIKVGKDTIMARKLHYTVDITSAEPRSKSATTAVLFAHKKALVTVTVESFKEADRPVTAHAVLSALSIVALPLKEKPIRVKLLDAEGHIHRYVTMELPKGFVAQHADCAHDVTATFVHRSAKPTAGRPAITIRRIEPPQKRGMNEFKNVVQWRMSDFEDMYHQIAPPTRTRVSGQPAYQTHYLDKSEEGNWEVYDVIFQLRDQIWVITMDIDSNDLTASKDGPKQFGKLLKSVAAWIGK